MCVNNVRGCGTAAVDPHSTHRETAPSLTQVHGLSIRKSEAVSRSESVAWNTPSVRMQQHRRSYFPLSLRAMLTCVNSVSPCGTRRPPFHASAACRSRTPPWPAQSVPNRSCPRGLDRSPGVASPASLAHGETYSWSSHIILTQRLLAIINKKGPPGSGPFLQLRRNKLKLTCSGGAESVPSPASEHTFSPRIAHSQIAQILLAIAHRPTP